MPPYGKGGNSVMYWQFMLDYYGREVIDKLIAESAETRKYTILDYEQLIQQYTERTEAMLKDPSLAVLDTPITDF